MTDVKNHWDLYESRTGWEAAATVLDEATRVALDAADRQIAAGETARTAAMQAFQSVLNVMDRTEIATFGGADSEPREILAHKIHEHMRLTHHTTVNIDRWGGA
jgi:hypothetical protein